MEKNKFTHGSLFSGIGGPEIAAEEMGWKNMFHCEINPFGRKILDYWFPNSKSYEDITKTNFTEWRGKINVLTGGFPCQPFSCAGQRKGAEDDRYLWPEMLRAIREIQPIDVEPSGTMQVLCGSFITKDGRRMPGTALEFEKAIDWEQRRYEIAKEIMKGFSANSHNQCVDASSETLAQWSISGADALIAELKKGGKG